MRHFPSGRFSPWLLPIVLVGAFLLGLKQITDVDALLHLSMGKLFVSLKGIPANEPFCYPVAETAFLYTSWLFATISYLVFDWFGASAMSLVVAGAAVLLAWILYRDAHLLTGENHGIIQALAVVTGLLLAEDRFVLRPELVLYLAFAAQIWILGQWVFADKRRGLWLLPVIALLWGNSHSSVILLVVPFGCFASYLVVEILWPGQETARNGAVTKLKWLVGLCALSVVAALCNPNGIDQFRYGQSVMGDDWYKSAITELMPPRAKELRIIWPMFVLSVGLSLWGLKRKSLPYLLTSVAVLYVGLSAVRFFAFFCLMQAPIIGRALSVLAARWQDKLKLRESMAVAVAAMLILLLAVLKAGSFFPLKRDVISEERFGLGYHVPIDHAEAVAYLKRHGLKGRVFNIFEDGQAIIWNGWPDLTVFIDGRGALPPEMLDAYSAAFSDPGAMRELQQRFGFEVILMRRFESFQFNPHGATGFFVNAAWVPTYFDKESYVFLRRGGPYQAIIDQKSYPNILPNADFKSYAEIIDQRPAYAKSLLNEMLQAPESSLSAFDRIIIGYCYYRTGNLTKAEESVAPYRYMSSLSMQLYGRILKALGRQAEAQAVFQEGLTRYGSADFQRELLNIKDGSSR